MRSGPALARIRHGFDEHGLKPPATCAIVVGSALWQQAAMRERMKAAPPAGVSKEQIPVRHRFSLYKTVSAD